MPQAAIALKLDADLAQAIADEYLANEVENLLMAGEGSLNEEGKARWVVVVLLERDISWLCCKLAQHFRI